MRLPEKEMPTVAVTQRLKKPKKRLRFCPSSR